MITEARGWPQSLFSTRIAATEAEALAPVVINLDVRLARPGGAVTMNMQKKSVIRAEWKPVHVSQGSNVARPTSHVAGGR